MKPSALNLNTLLIRNLNQVFTDLDEEIIMLNVENSEYYNLPGSAGRIWYYLADAMTLKELIEKLTIEYDVSFEDCMKDVQPFIEELLGKNIVQIANED